MYRIFIPMDVIAVSFARVTVSALTCSQPHPVKHPDFKSQCINTHCEVCTIQLFHCEPAKCNRGKRELVCNEPPCNVLQCDHRKYVCDLRHDYECSYVNRVWHPGYQCLSSMTRCIATHLFYLHLP